ncbi:MAG: single-stranded-DNA-specific exonuclease [Lentisphaeria bacterium]|jgi:single-stranded-DNA-specific exonuclease
MKKTIVRRGGDSSDSALVLAERNGGEYNGGEQGLEALIQMLYRHRGVKSDTQNNCSQQYSLQKILRPDTLLGLEAAIDILVAALMAQEKIVVVGDFDADGATSTALAVSCLHAFGFRHVDYLVPNRFEFGYGLTPEIVEVTTSLSPNIIITVDNGISSIDGVAYAKSKGYKVIVTDHHLPGRETPDADAIVNPNQRGCPFPSKHLAGVGVIFYLMSALRSALRKMNWFEKKAIPEPSMGQYLDLVALGTVADVVPLDYNNRILVAAGLRKMRSGNALPGIQALLSIAAKDAKSIGASDLGFAVGPRLNAAGRLDDMSLGIRCLLSVGIAEALEYARELDDLNRDRKLIESSMQVEAQKILDETLAAAALDTGVSGVCLYKDDWHQGVIGILASRIKDAVHRPTIIFAKTESGELKGSGRSIGGVHLRDVLDEIATQNPGLIEKFGGHAMAAGMSLVESRLENFKRLFDACVKRHLTDENAKPVVFSDGQLPEALLTLATATAIREAGPWGQHFPEPTFDGVFYIVQQRIVGGKHLKLMLSAEPYSNLVFDAIAFNIDAAQWPNPELREMHIAYKLDINEYRGNKNVQLLVDYIDV